MQAAQLKSLLPLSLLGALRSLKWSRTVAAFDSKVVSHSYGGKRLTLHIADPVAQQWYDRDCPDLDELGLLIRCGALAGKRNVFVLGAHQAVVSLVVSHYIEPGGAVLAVEGTRFNVTIGRRNIAANQARGVQMLHAVVGAAPGTAEFVSVGNGYMGRGRKEWTETVESVSLDSLAERYGAPDFVFLDIEGVEFSALEHAALLGRRTAAWAVELHGDAEMAHYSGSNNAVVALFRNAGYAVSVLEPNTVFTPLRASERVTSHRTHIYCVPQ